MWQKVTLRKLKKLRKLRKPHETRINKRFHGRFDCPSTGGRPTIRETAKFIKVSERTLYQWIADGKRLWRLLYEWEIREEDLSLSDMTKVRLYEQLKQKPIDVEVIHAHLEDAIEAKRIERENREDDRARRRRQREDEKKKNRAAENAKRRKRRADDQFLKKQSALLEVLEQLSRGGKSRGKL